jgi:hypothetical protein
VANAPNGRASDPARSRLRSRCERVELAGGRSGAAALLAGRGPLRRRAASRHRRRRRRRQRCACAGRGDRVVRRDRPERRPRRHDPHRRRLCGHVVATGPGFDGGGGAGGGGRQRRNGRREPRYGHECAARPPRNSRRGERARLRRSADAPAAAGCAALPRACAAGPDGRARPRSSGLASGSAAAGSGAGADGRAGARSLAPGRRPGARSDAAGGRAAGRGCIGARSVRRRRPSRSRRGSRAGAHRRAHAFPSSDRLGPWAGPSACDPAGGAAVEAAAAAAEPAVRAAAIAGASLARRAGAPRCRNPCSTVEARNPRPPCSRGRRYGRRGFCARSRWTGGAGRSFCASGCRRRRRGIAPTAMAAVDHRRAVVRDRCGCRSGREKDRSYHWH